MNPAAVAEKLKAGGRTALDATAERTAQVMAAAQALLASDLSADLNNLVAAAVKGSATIYDKAMDANYLDPLLRPDLGGSYHRLFDGGHTIAGAVRTARDASPDDTIIAEALGTVQALLRDAATPRGLPLATWDKSTFDTMADSLESTFAIPKSWFYDLNTYDAADLLGASVGVVAVAWDGTVPTPRPSPRSQPAWGCQPPSAPIPYCWSSWSSLQPEPSTRPASAASTPNSSTADSKAPSAPGPHWRRSRSWARPAGPPEWRSWSASPRASSPTPQRRT